MPIEQLKGEIERVLREMGVEQTPDIVLERPRNAEHGDFASNVAMTLAKPLHRPPRQIAEELVRRIDVAGAGIDSVHTVWMELHEDYLLTQGITREQEGSY